MYFELTKTIRISVIVRTAYCITEVIAQDLRANAIESDLSDVFQKLI